MSTVQGREAVPACDPVALVARIAQGDRGAERLLFAHYHRGLRALVARHCRPRDPAIDDITQEILRIVLAKLRAREIEDAASLPRYLQMCATRAATNEYRRRADKAEVELGLQAEAIPAPDPDPAEAIERGAMATQLHSLVAALPVERDREVLARFYLREQSKDEICRALGIDEDHFRRVVHRARARLRELIDARAPGLSP